MYKSPIELMIADIQHQIAKEQDEEIYKAVVHYIPNIDKEELIRALRYDRNQYQAGYLEGKSDAMASIVRCKDCKHSSCNPVKLTYACNHPLGLRGFLNEGFYFCSHGERRNGK